MSKNLNCISCGKPRSIGRRICSECNKARLIRIVSLRPRYTWKKECFVCRNEFIAWRKRQKACRSCRDLIISLSQKTLTTNNYINIAGVLEHRFFAEKYLGRKLDPNEVVHHVDENPKNNSRENLSIMSRETHGRLHLFLNTIRAFCYTHGNIDFFYKTIRLLTEQWSFETQQEIIFCDLKSNAFGRVGSSYVSPII